MPLLLLLPLLLVFFLTVKVTAANPREGKRKVIRLIDKLGTTISDRNEIKCVLLCSIDQWVTSVCE